MTNANTKTKHESVIQFFRLAVAKMIALSIPPNAQNYTIWYEYFTNENPNLSREIESLLTTEESFTTELNDDLYNRYFDGASSKQLNEMRDAIGQLVRHLSVQLADLVEDMDDYDKVLATCETQLNHASDIETLDKLISTLVTETQKARTASQSTSSLVNELNTEIKQMQSAMAELNEETLIDPLTGIGNRRAFDQELKRVLVKSSSGQRQFCLLMMDIDHFKIFNDTHGHLAGDSVLRYVAKKIKQGTKGGDFVARYGGEEFSLILPNTDYGGGMVVARAIAEKISKRTLTTGKERRSMGNVTLSIGLASFQLDDTAESIIDRSDRCLYRAKSEGRNKVVGEKD